MTRSVRRYRLLTRQLAVFGKSAVRIARSRQREIAGVLLERDGLLQLVELRNVSRRRGSFEIRRTDVVNARHAARVLSSSVAGTFHSHVVSEARPGPRDIREAREGGVMLIYDTIAHEWRLWRIRHGRAYELKYDQI